MSRNHTSPPSPNAPSSDVTGSRQLYSAFEAMFLDASDVAGGDFDDDWGVADTKEALALSFVHDARLKDCIVHEIFLPVYRSSVELFLLIVPIINSCRDDKNDNAK